MRYGSVCSGIEAASAAWHPLGWKAAWFSEIEPFPCSVLKHHYQDVPNFGDMTEWETWPDGPIDILVGGTPCQSFSVAGKRAGLDDHRGQLALAFPSIAARYRPRWIVWENVPGVLSSRRGRDFGSFFGSLVKLGYGCAYRVLDAQYFGVAQRRRRVFVVGHLGDWRRAAAVLFESEGLRRDNAKGGKAREGVAEDSGNGAEIKCFGCGVIWHPDGLLECCPVCGANQGHCAELAPTIDSSYGRLQGISGQDLNHGQSHLIAFPANLSATQHASTENLSPAMGAKNPTAVANGMQVRRLTPIECERLQGFADNYTNVPHRGKPAADGPRYKALGNSMAVPVMAWIGKRIQKVEAIKWLTN